MTGSNSQEPESKKPKWQRFLETTGGTALITVLLGGIFGSIISASFQSSQKEREFQQSWLKARGDQALIAYKDYLEKQQDIVKRVYERLGGSISAADDLITLTSPEFATTNFEGEQKERVRKYRGDVRDKFGAAERQWRDERGTLGLLMSYYNPKQNAVLGAWKNISNSVTDYFDCASDWLNKHPISDESATACKKEKDVFDSNLEELTKALEINRTYAWQGWESPASLKSALDKKE
jgi:hypothetical protein